MDRIRIRGGQRLTGEIPISGAKNAALPLMIASLLTEETLRLCNVPRLHDVALLLRILRNHGADTTLKGKQPGQDNGGQHAGGHGGGSCGGFGHLFPAGGNPA